MTAPFANRYAPLGLLGEGTMGQVWRVADTLENDAEKALKLIKSDTAPTETQCQRFMAEFRAMAGLRHPNTVDVHDWGVLPDGNRYIAMALVPGSELADLIGGRPLAVASVYPLLIQLVQALDFIHSRGYVHRDVKAANIRVTPDQTLKLMDFGLMTRPDAATGRAITGTPGYMAPELIQGGALTPAADLYAVGCLAYEMLTGQLPFQGTVGEVLRAHAGTRPQPLRPPVPDGLARLVGRLLAKVPTDRPASAGVLLDELAALAGVALTRESADQAASFLQTSELVGRDAELTCLNAALTAAASGRGQAVYLDAPAGTGKSRLVEALSLQAKLAGWHVLPGQAHAHGMAPYEALQTAFHTAFTGDAATVADAVYAQLAASQAPVLWLMDDLHGADAPSVAVMGLVARRLGDLRVLLLGTLRGDETPAGATLWRALDEGGGESMALAPLDRDGQRALLRAMLPDAHVPEPFAAALDAATGGNPFFIGEVLRSLLEDGHLARFGGKWRFPSDPAVLRPLRSIQATVRRRLDHLSRSARRLIGACAVLGATWDRAQLLAVTGMSEADIRADLCELTARQLVERGDDGRWRFPHDRVRETAYAALPPAVRRALHQRAGEALDTDDANPDDLARHFLQGDGGERAYHWLMRAAERADAATADGLALARWAEAEGVLDALDAPTDFSRRVALWFTIGWNGAMHTPDLARTMLGKLTHAIELHPDAVAGPLAAATVTPSQVYRLLAAAEGFGGLPVAALATAERGRKLLVGPGALAEAAAHYVGCGGLVAAGRIDEAIAEAVSATAAYDRIGELPRFESSSRAGAFAVQNARAFQGLKPDAALRDQARTWAQHYGDNEPFTVWFYFGLWAAWTGHVDEAEAYIEMTTQKSRRIAAPPYPWVLYLRPYLLWQRGWHALALEQVDRALLAHPHLRQTALAFHHMLALRGHLLCVLGRRAESLAVFDDLLAVADSRGLGLSRMLALDGRGLTLESPTEARAAHAELEHLVRAGPWRNPLYLARATRGLGRTALALGDRDAAERYLREALAIASDPAQDNLFLQAHIQRDLAKLALRRGDREAGKTALTAAGDLFAAMRNPHGLHAVTQDLEPLLAPGTVPTRTEAAPDARWHLMRGMLG